MAFTIILQTTTSETNKIGKTKSNNATLSGTLRDNCSLTDPKIIVGAATITSNYAYISTFSRYYFIKKITALRTGLWELELHVDVLESYASQIKALSAVIKRQQNVYNLYLDDPRFQAQNKKQIVTKKLVGSSPFSPSGLTGASCFVLTTVGGVSS